MSEGVKQFQPKGGSVEAIQLKLFNFDEVVAWIDIPSHSEGYVKVDEDQGQISFKMLFGYVTAGYNWWIVRTKTGKVYPMSPKTFKQKYEEVNA